MRIIQRIALVLAIIGCINWLTIGLFDFNIVGFLFDDISTVISRIVYVIVGICGLICTSFFFENDREY
jgi:uncharacterized membrane protein YuzA (DUF378 family)